MVVVVVAAAVEAGVGGAYVLFHFSPLFSLMLLNPEGNGDGTGKEIKFGVESVIMHSAGEPGFRGTPQRVQACMRAHTHTHVYPCKIF